MIDNIQLRKLIIEPVLRGLSLYSPEAEDLLVGTLALESKGLTYIIQVMDEKNDNPQDTLNRKVGGLGPYQMQHKTHEDMWTRYMPAHPKIVNDMMLICMFSRKPTSAMMVYNLFYATAMARIYYASQSEPIPKTLTEQADYYKTYWNTREGKATAEQYILDYNNFNGIVIKKDAKK